MSNNQISLLKFNYKTNVRGHTKYVPYSILNSDKTIPESMVKNNINIPANCLLFSDLIPFSENDYSKHYSTFLKSLVSISEFSTIFKGKLSKKYGNKKINRKEAFEDNIHEHNLLLLTQLIFKFGSPFYLSNDENPYTIIKMKEAVKPRYVNKSITWKKNKFRLYEYDIFLKLTDKVPGNVSNKDRKHSECEDIKYTLDANIYNMMSEYAPTDGMKEYYKQEYDDHLNTGEPIIEKKNTPKLYSKRGGTYKQRSKIMRKTRKTLRK